MFAFSDRRNVLTWVKNIQQAVNIWTSIYKRLSRRRLATKRKTTLGLILVQFPKGLQPGNPREKLAVSNTGNRGDKRIDAARSTGASKLGGCRKRKGLSEGGSPCQQIKASTYSDYNNDLCSQTTTGWGSVWRLREEVWESVKDAEHTVGEGFDDASRNGHNKMASYLLSPSFPPTLYLTHTHTFDFWPSFVFLAPIRCPKHLLLPQLYKNVRILSLSEKRQIITTEKLKHKWDRKGKTQSRKK